jgi:hypothetical protein
MRRGDNGIPSTRNIIKYDHNETGSRLITPYFFGVSEDMGYRVTTYPAKKKNAYIKITGQEYHQV